MMITSYYLFTSAYWYENCANNYVENKSYDLQITILNGLCLIVNTNAYSLSSCIISSLGGTIYKKLLSEVIKYYCVNSNKIKIWNPMDLLFFYSRLFSEKKEKKKV